MTKYKISDTIYLTRIAWEEIMDEQTLRQEQKSIGDVQLLIDKQIEDIDSQMHDLAKRNYDAMKYVLSENLDVVEMAEAYGEINSKDEHLGELTSTRLFLKRIRSKPFFARLVFDNLDNGHEDLYVGLKNIEKDGHPVVIDWRVPVASLLYFSSLGKTSYTAPVGEIEVDLKLKRQYRISNGELQSYVDTNVKIDDEVLQEVLSRNTSSYMSNIVQSIQAEQNAIIRKNPNYSVIINGIAGSGKTSIAMHRISYILYALKGKIKSKNIRIISPNPMFSEYISKLLPELGEENVEAESILEFMRTFGVIPIKMDASRKEMVEDCFTNPLRQKSVNEKFSPSFYNKVENYLANYDLTKIIKSVKFENFYFTDEDIKQASQKIGFVKNIYERFLKMFAVLISSTDPYMTGKTFDKHMRRIKIKARTCFKTIEIMREMYNDFGMHLMNYNGKLAYEDIPVYGFIEYNTREFIPNYFIKHVFIDEVQDYDPFSLSLLRSLYPEAVFTAVGDYNQNLLSTQTNLPILKALLPNVDVDELDTSYRSSHEIVDFSSKIMGRVINTSLVRHGEKPVVKRCLKENIETEISKIASRYPNDKIAIILKTDKQAEELAKLLKEFTLITKESDVNLLTKNLIITTIYLSKGLEYDRVILPELNQTNYNTQLDKQNLYVASTRALHGLYGFYDDKISEFVPKDYVE